MLKDGEVLQHWRGVCTVAPDVTETPSFPEKRKKKEKVQLFPELVLDGWIPSGSNVQSLKIGGSAATLTRSSDHLSGCHGRGHLPSLVPLKEEFQVPTRSRNTDTK